MINTIQLYSLFGLYSYQLELKSGGKPIRFVTGPNGYGKTTILKLLNCVYGQNLEGLSDIPFKKMVICFDDGYQLDVEQERIYDDDIESDEHDLLRVIITIDFSNIVEGLSERLVWDSENPVLPAISNLRGYLTSHPVYFIKDSRLEGSDDQRAVVENARKLAVWLKQDAEGRLTGKRDFHNRVETFKKVIDSYQFANKTFEINAIHGYLFRVASEQTPVLFGPGLTCLSSGEQQILIQAFDILLNAEDESLVLIDEPELSNHLEWQELFLSNLEKMVCLRQIQCIICTHAPETFRMRFDLTTDLYEQVNGLTHIV